MLGQPALRWHGPGVFNAPGRAQVLAAPTDWLATAPPPAKLPAE